MYISSQLFLETPHRTLKFEEKSKPEKESEERVLEMHFLMILGPKFSLWYLP